MTYLVSPIDPALRRVADPFPFDNPAMDPEEIEYLLLKNMHNEGGVGLAAPQLGISYQVISLSADPSYAMFNPLIIERSDKTEIDKEGCLSIPGVKVKVERPKNIVVKYLSREGKARIVTMSGFEARVVQHEIDHLRGILIIDHVSKLMYKMAKEKARKQRISGPFPTQMEISYGC